MTLYEQILSLPLFQGLSHDDLSDIVAHAKFDFTKVAAGASIVREGEPCHHLRFLLSGTAIMHSHADDNSYTVDEDVHAPLMIGIERLFGLRQYYAHSLTAVDDCSLLMLTKEEVMRLSDRMFIIRINLLNRLATDVQKLDAAPWLQRPTLLSEKLIRFFTAHSFYPAGHKTFHIKMQTLANEIGESRLNVSRKLNDWNARHIIILGRQSIDIPHLETLLQLKVNP